MPHEEAALSEVLCCECGKAIPSIPPWLADAKVKFECEECRSRHPRVGAPEHEPRRTAYTEPDDPDAGDEVADADDEADETDDAAEVTEEA